MATATAGAGANASAVTSTATAAVASTRPVSAAMSLHAISLRDDRPVVREEGSFFVCSHSFDVAFLSLHWICSLICVPSPHYPLLVALTFRVMASSEKGRPSNRICPECKNSNLGTHNFCEECGKKLVATASTKQWDPILCELTNFDFTMLSVREGLLHQDVVFLLPFEKAAFEMPEMSFVPTTDRDDEDADAGDVKTAAIHPIAEAAAGAPKPVPSYQWLKLFMGARWGPITYTTYTALWGNLRYIPTAFSNAWDRKLSHVEIERAQDVVKCTFPTAYRAFLEQCYRPLVPESRLVLSNWRLDDSNPKAYADAAGEQASLDVRMERFRLEILDSIAKMLRSGDLQWPTEWLHGGSAPKDPASAYAYFNALQCKDIPFQELLNVFPIANSMNYYFMFDSKSGGDSDAVWYFGYPDKHLRLLQAAPSLRVFLCKYFNDFVVRCRGWDPSAPDLKNQWAPVPTRAAVPRYQQVSIPPADVVSKVTVPFFWQRFLEPSVLNDFRDQICAILEETLGEPTKLGVREVRQLVYDYLCKAA